MNRIDDERFSLFAENISGNSRLQAIHLVGTNMEITIYV